MGSGRYLVRRHPKLTGGGLCRGRGVLTWEIGVEGGLRLGHVSGHKGVVPWQGL